MAKSSGAMRRASAMGAGGNKSESNAVNQNSFMKDLSSMALSPEQIWNINQQRLQMREESRTWAIRNGTTERPRLSDAMLYRYDDYARGDENALKGVSYKNLESLRSRAKYDLSEAHDRFSRTSYDVELDRWKEYERGSTNGEKWERAVQDVQRAEKVYSGIRAEIQRRANSWAEKRERRKEKR